MSTSPIKNEEYYRKIAEISNNVKLHVNQSTVELFSQIYTSLELEILTKLKKSCVDGFKHCIDMYDSLENLTKIYNNALSLYENSIANTDVEQKYKLLNEIKTMVKMQVTKFDTIRNEDGDNPLILEINNYIEEDLPNLRSDSNIYKENLRGFLRSLDFVEIDGFKQDLKPVSMLISFVQNQESFIDLYPVIARVILQERLEQSSNIYKAYIKSYEGIIGKLCKFNHNVYFDMLKQNYNIISLISKFQIVPFRKSLASDTESTNLQPVKEFLTIIDSAYLEFSVKYNEILDKVNTEDKFSFYPNISYADFTDVLIYLNINDVNDDIIPSLQDKVVPLLDDMKELISKLIENTKANEDANDKGFEIPESFKPDLDKMLGLSHDITDQFEIIVSFYDTNQGELQSQVVADVVTGIKETLDIKMEGIYENDFEFKEQGNSLIEEFNKTLSTLPEKYLSTKVLENSEDVKNYDKEIELMLKLSIALITGSRDNPITDKQVKEILEVSLNSKEGHDVPTNKPVLSDIEKEIKDLETVINKWKKAVFSYKKDYLFYELRSFEELMIHSVSRLREEQDKIIKEFVFRMDMVNIQINDLLNKENTTYIIPEPHDKFVAREHEVLMSEKSPEFTQGEIIRVLNKGFIHNDEIILRANVIAAK